MEEELNVSPCDSRSLPSRLYATCNHLICMTSEGPTVRTALPDSLTGHLVRPMAWHLNGVSASSLVTLQGHCAKHPETSEVPPAFHSIMTTVCCQWPEWVRVTYTIRGCFHFPQTRRWAVAGAGWSMLSRLWVGNSLCTFSAFPWGP